MGTDTIPAPYTKNVGAEPNRNATVRERDRQPADRTPSGAPPRPKRRVPARSSPCRAESRLGAAGWRFFATTNLTAGLAASPNDDSPSPTAKREGPEDRWRSTPDQSAARPNREERSRPPPSCKGGGRPPNPRFGWRGGIPQRVIIRNRPGNARRRSRRHLRPHPPTGPRSRSPCARVR